MAEPRNDEEKRPRVTINDMPIEEKMRYSSIYASVEREVKLCRNRLRDVLIYVNENGLVESLTVEQRKHLMILRSRWSRSPAGWKVDWLFELKEHHDHFNEKITHPGLAKMWSAYILKVAGLRIDLRALHQIWRARVDGRFS